MYETILPSFIITFREALEAALLVTIMVTYLNKIGKKQLTKYAYAGTFMALVVSIVIGIAVQTLYGGMDKVTAEIFEGVASLTAVAVLTSMILWMTEHSKEIKGNLEGKIEYSVTQGELYGIASLAFVAVFREGLETVLFLSATFLQDSAGTIVGIILGASVVLILSILLMRGTVNLEISKFFKVTSILLVVFGAGLAGYGVHELIEAGENSGMDLGVLSEKPYDINPPLNPDGSYPLLHENGIVGSVFKALMGYDGNPEWLRIIVYVGYWAVIGTYLLRKYRQE
ncbi:MAG: FTR1 family protein [Candidatus Bathyarchaeota archaeon]|nr:FTR1 family protein [Candidatus Bathyarchaeota archaeon]